MKTNRTIKLPNRYRDDVELVPVSEDKWLLKAPKYVRFGIKNTGEVSFFDPPGGPMVELEDTIKGMVVVAIETTEKETFVWLLPADCPDFESKKGKIRAGIKRIVVDEPECRRFVVGMIGKAGSGKDTVGDYLRDKYGFTSLALADTLKRGIQEMFVIPDDVMYDRKKREEPLPDMPKWSVRKLLQYVGTELIRHHIDDAAWTKSLIKRYPETGNIVVTDVRFPNEVEGIREMSGCPVFFIKVVRPGCVGVDVGLKNHASETHDLEGNFELVNSTTIEDLYAKVDWVMAEIWKTVDG